MSDSRVPERSNSLDETPAAWDDLVASLREAGKRLAADTEGLDPLERADAYRSLIRALNNQLSRFEVDRERPELVPFNGWREKFFMDNPDFRYWVADIADGGHYRIVGTRGDAVYVSVTAYAGTGNVEAAATSRLDSDAIRFDDEGGYEIIVGGPDPGPGVDHLPLPAGATALWVRHFHLGVDGEVDGSCRIEPVGDVAQRPPIDPGRFANRLRRLGQTMEFVPSAWRATNAAEDDRHNEIRHWSEMAGGAVYTEPGIHYLRGTWSLEPGEALVIEGDVVDCRYWNVMLYSRFLGSLDFRSRRVSATGATATIVDGRYRFVVAASPPPGYQGDWLDTEGRPYGLVVFRWLHPESEPTLPSVEVRRLDELHER